MSTFLIGAHSRLRYQFVAFAWLVLPTLDVVDKFTKTDCLLTPMVDNRFCWTVNPHMQQRAVLQSILPLNLHRSWCLSSQPVLFS
jgi:hypothetical protein